MTTHYLDVPYLDTDVGVEFDYYKGYGGNQFEPPEAEEVEIIKVTFKGVDVTDIIDKETLTDALIDYIHELQEQMRHDKDYSDY